MIHDKKIPGVSIIMPTYNRAGFIGETISSVLRQTFTDWELIIVDDGSTDETETIISQLRDPRIQFHKAGRIGINGMIKNIGIRKAAAALLAFIDSDDLWASAKLEKQVAALRQYPEAAFSLTGGYNFKVIDQPLDFFYKEKEGIRYGDVFLSFFNSDLSATTPSLLIRKECIVQTGFFDETRPFSDVDFILRLARKYKAVILLEPLLYRRLHAGNDSGAHWEPGYAEGIRLIRANRTFLPGGVARNSFFHLYMNYGEDCLLHKQCGKAINQFLKGWTNKPISIIPLKKIIKAIGCYFKN